MDVDEMTPGQILADANVADFIGQLGLSIAEAQKALDENSVNQISEFIEPRASLGNRSLLDLGLSPAFYHYQHADISCALQINLRVEKDLSVGVNLEGSFNDNQTSDNSSDEASSSSSSGTSERTQTRTAQVEIQSASVGQLTINGTNFPLTGADPLARIRNLQRAVSDNMSTGVQRLLYSITPLDFNITSDAPSEKVRTGLNTIAFIGGGFDRGVLKVASNEGTTYVLNDENAVVAEASTSDLADYAARVKDLIEAKNYDTILLAPNDSIQRFHFETGSQYLRSFVHDSGPQNVDLENRLQFLASLINELGIEVEVEGFADAQQFRRRTETESDALNTELGLNRAKEVERRLLANGVASGKITPMSSGDNAAEENVRNNGGDVDDINFRKVEIRVKNRTAFWLIVKSRSGGPNLETISPDFRANPQTAGNGFIYLYKPTALELSGKKVTIRGVDFTISGASGGGFASGSPAAHAFNLSKRIHDNTQVDFTSSAEQNIVTVFKKDQPFQLSLATAETRNIQMTSTEGIEIKTQFSRTQSQSASTQNTGNRTVAVGATVDVRFSRQFESNITGNSSISARLVSIPAPPQFLETIRDFLNGDGG